MLHTNMWSELGHGPDPLCVGSDAATATKGANCLQLTSYWFTPKRPGPSIISAVIALSNMSDSNNYIRQWPGGEFIHLNKTSLAFQKPFLFELLVIYSFVIAFCCLLYTCPKMWLCVLSVCVTKRDFRRIQMKARCESEIETWISSDIVTLQLFPVSFAPFPSGSTLCISFSHLPLLAHLLLPPSSCHFFFHPINLPLLAINVCAWPPKLCAY